MDRINSIGRMLEMLRRRVSETARGEPGKRVAGKSAESPTAAAPPARSLETLRTLVRSRLSAIDADDPQRDARVRRVFVETVVTWEFGDAILNDPQYEQLIRHVESQLETGDGGGARLVAMMRELAG